MKKVRELTDPSDCWRERINCKLKIRINIWTMYFFSIESSIYLRSQGDSSKWAELSDSNFAQRLSLDSLLRKWDCRVAD